MSKAREALQKIIEHLHEDADDLFDKARDTDEQANRLNVMAEILGEEDIEMILRKVRDEVHAREDVKTETTVPQYDGESN